MNGIYLTREGKREIETLIVELEKSADYYESINSRHRRGGCLAKIFTLQEILSSATILPVEESFYAVENKLKYHCGRTGCSKDGATLREYPNGVIIQPKQ